MAQKYVFDPIGFVIATVITFLFVGFIFHWFDGIIAFTWLLIRVIAVVLIIGIVIYIIYYLINQSNYGVVLGKNIRQWMPNNKDQNKKTSYKTQSEYLSKYASKIDPIPYKPQNSHFTPQGQSIKTYYEIPSDEPTRHIPSEVKRAVYARDKGECVLCGSTRNIHYDHDIPFSKGGSNSEKNIRILCEKCNLKKSDKIE